MATERPSAIVPVTQVEDKFMRMLLYGDPGVGKTVLVSTAPNCLILEADPKGTVSAAVRNSSAQKWKIETHDDLLEVYEFLRHGGAMDFDWVWLDSLTLFQERGLDQIMDDLVANKPHRSRYQPDKGEYFQNMNRISLWLRNMVALPVNFGVTAHSNRTEDEDGKVTYMPAIQGRNMPEKICAYMSIVAYMYARRKEGKVEIGIRTRKDSKHYAKDRFDAVPNGLLLDPTIPKLEKLVRDKLGVDAPRTSPSRRRGSRVARTGAQSKTTTKTRKVT